MSMISKDGGTFFRPLFFDFPTDSNAYLNQTHNVMLGPGLKASFQSTENATKTHYYFPDGVWCSVFQKNSPCLTGPRIQELPSEIFETFTHIKDGNIVPLQSDVVGRNRTTTKVDQLLKNPVELHIHPQIMDEQIDMACIATGNLISDDGKTLNTTNKQNSYQFDFKGTIGCGVEQKNDNNGSIILNVTQLAEAKALDKMNATTMDFLGKIVIYNTAIGDFVMNGKYDITVMHKDSTTTTLKKQAEFNS